MTSCIGNMPLEKCVCATSNFIAMEGEKPFLGKCWYIELCDEDKKKLFKDKQMTNTDWFTTETMPTDQHIVIWYQEAEDETRVFDSKNPLSYNKEKIKGWMPYELALKKLNAPLCEWQDINKNPIPQGESVLILLKDKEIVSSWFLSGDNFREDTVKNILSKATYWRYHQEPPLPKKPELKLYVGMYVKTACEEYFRVEFCSNKPINDLNVFYSPYDICAWQENGKCIESRENKDSRYDIIAEATREEYIAYVTRAL